jgi:hypothetical protein
MPRKEQINWVKMLEEIEFEEGRQASGKRQERTSSTPLEKSS